MTRIFSLLAALLLAAPAVARAPTLDAVAEHYVKLSLVVGTHEDGYIDAYYGPPAWQASAKADKRPLSALAADATSLAADLSAADRANRKAPSLVRRRIAFLHGQIRAMQTRLAMLQGKKLSFEDEAEGLFSVRPTLKPLAAYDPILAKIDALVPGEGALSDRVDAFNMRYRIPPDRLDAVMRAAIAECRARTLAHIALPSNERFDLEFVTRQPWSGYNWYKGDAHSLIQVNTDLPIFLSRAVDLGCHEGYPGHHVLNMLLERNLAKRRGWVEFTVYPLFSPQSFIAEGTANYGIDLAFPGEERLRFEAKTLYPLAGLDPAAARAYFELGQAMRALSGARLTIDALYLDGKIGRDQAVELARKYQLMSKARADQSISFAERYRSYVINYGLGQDMAQAYVERAGRDPAARWKAMEHIIGGPTVPAELAR
ncbi:hypothetical protein [Flavisphingomonas formosensis]|uniref:hypothetical protein n=1 Tax=Flavisphingomonas formosensis TaxID=861534 RepID=UPI0012F9F3F9|nr:hypothetical protein [Sphingomonas formosensis]